MDILPRWGLRMWYRIGKPKNGIRKNWWAITKNLVRNISLPWESHHDNMDLWDSKYQPWNSVNMGPKRDVLAEWGGCSRKHKLPFGISFHADHAWTWYVKARKDVTGKGPRKQGFLTTGIWQKLTVKVNGGRDMTPKTYMHKGIPWVRKGGNTHLENGNGRTEPPYLQPRVLHELL